MFSSLKINRKDGDSQKSLSFDAALGEARSDDYPDIKQQFYITDVSYRREDFEKVFWHDGIVESWQCGGPLLDINGKTAGINVGRHDRTGTLALPAARSSQGD